MEQNIFVDVLTSLQRLLVGYIPAAIVGIFIGIFIGINRIVYRIFKRILQMARSIIPIALLPIALIVFKQIEPAAFVVVFMSALWTVIIDTAKGVRQFRQEGGNFRVAIHHIFRGLRIGIWVAWFTVIAIEMLTGGRGLGVVIWSAYNSRNPNYIIQAIIYISIIGFILDQLLDITGYFLSQIVLEGQQRDL
ncbi:ABC transporter permease [Mastigocladopsis repens]|uniref:ABC transporter permease n=1 Tax=Mastigocladopsis repens TaxID=221287 RepID=UPI000308CD05|nr:ABC transporter permease subunit [Mastigocladopsis repens]